ncbi:MAG: glycosyltransferase family 4 protein [Xanthomonadaceae bacterium]|jgi:glycosyltransferase involved in cell wall biosynthesis|nr:glycosyltransferase family 4 protein [Xanthomonadaceae bacterium]
MRVLVLSKRHSGCSGLTGERGYRSFELPEALAGLGHQVRGIALSYQRRPQFESARLKPDGAVWDSINGFPYSLIGARRHLRYIAETLGLFNPDIVWATSDAWQLYAGGRVAKSLGVPYVVDFSEDYETSNIGRLPGLASLLRRAYKDASGVTANGQALAEFVSGHYPRKEAGVQIIGDAATPYFFQPYSQGSARSMLGLPMRATLIGTAGKLTADYDIETLCRASPVLKERHPSLKLVLAGPRDESLKKLLHEDIIDLGILTQQRLALLFRALDVGVICGRRQGHDSPRDYHEMLASGLPFVAAETEEVLHLLETVPECRYVRGDMESLVERVDALLNIRRRGDLPAATWDERAQALQQFLSQVKDVAGGPE